LCDTTDHSSDGFEGCFQKTAREEASAGICSGTEEEEAFRQIKEWSNSKDKS
jgi:hypothetical protein